MSRARLALALLAGCDDTVWGSAGDGTEPPAQDGYAGVREISQGQCEGCHNAAGQQGGLDLQTDFALATVGVVGQYGIPLVVPGDPEGSFLYQKITDTHPDNTGTDMPPGRGGLPVSIAEVFYDWILDGATPE